MAKIPTGLLVTVLIFGSVIGLGLTTSIAEDKERNRLRQTTEQTDFRMQSIVDNLNNMLYFKDETTDICFAYAWNKSTNGGPMLASIPCAGLVTTSFWSNQ